MSYLFTVVALLPTTMTTTIDRCPRDYVIGLYATFADRFDDLLVNKLEYQTPTRLSQLVRQAMLMKRKNGIVDCSTTHNNDYAATAAAAAAAVDFDYFYKAIDLGCGTGLSGMAFRHLIAPPGRGGSLTGIDLSPEMIAKAKQRTWLCPPRDPLLLDEQSTSDDAVAQPQQSLCYDVLMVGDLELALAIDKNDGTLYSLVFACDVFCYIGDLKQIFHRVFNALNHGGIFAFSVELLVQPASTTAIVPFQLHECARFAHNQDYLNDLARNCGFKSLQTQTCPIRKNQGENVMGLLFVLEKDDRGS
jgi:predicted TPR repeat methyltransferase